MRLLSDETDMKHYLKKVEICRSKYQKGSLDLLASYDRNASHVSVIEVDDDRHQVQVECKLSYSKLNNRLEELGFARCSCVNLNLLKTKYLQLKQYIINMNSLRALF